MQKLTINQSEIKKHIINICLGTLIFALAGCGHSFTSAPTDAEVKSSIESAKAPAQALEMMNMIASAPLEPLTTEQQKAAEAALKNNDPSALLNQGIKVVGIERGTPRVSGAKEVIMGIPDQTDLFPIRVTINAMGGNRKIDFFFYKNDHNEWMVTPENQ
jgi:hypothetical protein